MTESRIIQTFATQNSKLFSHMTCMTLDSRWKRGDSKSLSSSSTNIEQSQSSVYGILPLKVNYPIQNCSQWMTHRSIAFTLNFMHLPFNALTIHHSNRLPAGLQTLRAECINLDSWFVWSDMKFYFVKINVMSPENR